MAKYINKQELLQKINMHRSNIFGIPLIIAEIEKAKSLELVMCNNCKYGDVSCHDKTKDGEETIACYCNLKNKVTNVDYYCPDGEEKQKN